MSDFRLTIVNEIFSLVRCQVLMTDKNILMLHGKNTLNDESTARDIFFEQHSMLNKFVYGIFITVNFKKMYHRDAS